MFNLTKDHWLFLLMLYNLTMFVFFKNHYSQIDQSTNTCVIQAHGL